MLKQKWMMGFIVLCVLFLLAACGNENNHADNNQLATSEPTDTAAKTDEPKQPSAEEEAERVANTPTELVFLYPPSGTDELFMERFGNQIQKKFPNYTLKFIPRDTNDAYYSTLLGSNDSIDIMISSLNVTGTYLTALDLQSDISDLIKKYDYDLSRIEPTLIDGQRELANGGIYGLPVDSGAMAFIYNKDIFDKFGVPYPSDDMTWDDLYDLAVTMTREDGGEQYKGIVFGLASLIRQNQMSAPYFDPETGLAAFTDDAFTEVFANIARFYKIPGMELPDHKYKAQESEFLEDQKVAMMLNTGGWVLRAANAQINWDIAQVPSLKEKPGVGFQAGPNYLYITSRSKNRDAAFQVLAYITSDEYQQWMVENLGFAPVLKDPSEVMQHFGANLAGGIQDKNVQALIPGSYAPMALPSEFTSTANSQMNSALGAFSAGKDINTALREATERTNEKIKQDTSK